MKQLLLLICSLAIQWASGQASKVAVLDFENTSGKAEYDALGKAMSNMLITDLKNNIHPRKVEFFERAQLNKLLDEQKLQKSKNFDAKTAVQFGKLSGVNYVFIGSIFVLDGKCNINSKLVDVQTSKILLAKEVNGAIESWLTLKTQLSEALSGELKNPISLPDSYKRASTPLSTLKQYGRVLSAMDEGDVEKAEQLRSMLEETNPDFAYFKDLRDDIDALKKQVAKNTADIEVLNQSGGRVVNPQLLPELVTNITNPLSSHADRIKYMGSILTYSIQEVEAIVSRFDFLCGFPAGTEFLQSFDYNAKSTTPKTIDLISKDLDFIDAQFDSETANKITLSYFAFFYLRSLAKFNTIYGGMQLIMFEKGLSTAQKLVQYNKKNNIPSYDVKVFGGQMAYSSRFRNDTDLRAELLVDLLR
jgi:TolB-like protein